MSEERLGLDFGKVIMGAVRNGRGDTAFLGTTFDEAMNSPPEPGAIEATKRLVDAFAGKVWIVSRCGPAVEHKTRGWLKHRDFYRATGLEPGNVRFCRERSEKATICKQLRITHFVDDRLDVLEPMRDVVPNLYLFGEQRAGTVSPEWIRTVENWNALLEMLLADKAG